MFNNQFGTLICKKNLYLHLLLIKYNNNYESIEGRVKSKEAYAINMDKDDVIVILDVQQVQKILVDHARRVADLDIHHGAEKAVHVHSLA